MAETVGSPRRIQDVRQGRRPVRRDPGLLVVFDGRHAAVAAQFVQPVRRHLRDHEFEVVVLEDGNSADSLDDAEELSEVVEQSRFGVDEHPLGVGIGVEFRS